MLYVGLISGTSADAIDTALVEIDKQKIQLITALSFPYPDQLQTEIRAAFHDIPTDETIAKLDHAVGRSFAQAVDNLLDAAGVTPRQITAIGSHGQTLRHEPDIAQPYSLQVGNGPLIAVQTGITTVNDFRRADIASGGQGAPLAPALHAALFRSRAGDRAIVNIGGIANITHLPADPAQTVIGFDSGPGNTLLDAWIRQTRGQPFDNDGAWAQSGHVHDRLLELLLTDPYFDRTPPKSTGFEYFNLDWLATKQRLLEIPVSPEDIQATLLALTAKSIAGALPPVTEVYICGGGVHNRALMDSLTTEMRPVPVASTEQLGLHPDWVEATTFAWLAHRRLQGLPGNLPSVTGASKAVPLGIVHKPR